MRAVLVKTLVSTALQSGMRVAISRLVWDARGSTEVGERAVHYFHILDLQSVGLMRYIHRSSDRAETGLVRSLQGTMAAFLGSTH